MKIKLDENLGERGRRLLASAGHDVCTVPAQALTSADDRELIEACRREGRALVTLDMDKSARVSPNRLSRDRRDPHTQAGHGC